MGSCAMGIEQSRGGPRPFFVNGQWRRSDLVRSVTNPFDGKTVGRVCQATQTDIDEAIGCAGKAFEDTRKTSAFERHRILSGIAGALQDKREEFARMITLETGKPISLSRAEVDRSSFTFSIAAEEARRLEGDVLPLDLNLQSVGRFGLVRRFPLGPVSAITPFNFPLNLVAHKVAPAIAAGNSVVLKPSSGSPQVALDLGLIIAETGFPTGGINIVPCAADEASQLITDERIKLLTFTGSPAIGWPMKARAGKKRVTLELGGNAAVVVEPDADLDEAAWKVVNGGFSNAGQSCISVQRVFIHCSIWEHFRSRLLELTERIVVGNPFDEKTVVGPMINEEAAQRIEEWIAEAVQSGARLLCGGGRSGAVVQATILENVDPSMKVSCLEAFAPVIVLEAYDRFEEALRAVNASNYGLQAGIFTMNLKKAFEAYELLNVGGVVLNDVPSYRIDHMPYGGVKDSGFGREGVKFAIEEMTELKLLVVNPI
jgi:acyl-CoA reductase-like NAD-dependent aldehyde dehydrogenase